MFIQISDETLLNSTRVVEAMRLPRQHAGNPNLPPIESVTLNVLRKDGSTVQVLIGKEFASQAWEKLRTTL